MASTMFSLLALSVSFACAPAGCESCDWEAKRVTLDQRTRDASGAHTGDAATLLSAGVRAIREDPPARRVRADISSVFKAARSVLGLQMVGGGALGVRYVWIVDGPVGVELRHNLHGAEERQRLEPRRWRDLVEELERTPWSQLVSGSEYSVMDGTVYLVTLCHGGRCGQFALYGVVSAADARGGQLAERRFPGQERVIRSIIQNALRERDREKTPPR